MNWSTKKPEVKLGTPPFEMPELIWQVLAKRGYKEKSEIERLIKSPLKDLTPPTAMKDMEEAVERLALALERDEKVCVYADFDLDGTPGLALMETGLIGLGFKKKNLILYQPSRLSEGYGLHIEALNKLKDQGVNLVVTVDLGITAIEAAKHAREIGIDMIITDHHLPGEELPDAFAVVNPNRKDCDSGLGYLAGVGVAFYTIMALRQKLKETSAAANDFNLKSLLDCFCIGTITDMVPLVGDNRILVKHGLVQLASTPRVGLRLLLSKLGLLGKELNSQDVALRFAPKLNALSRLEAGVLPIDIFRVTEIARAEELIAQVLTTNDQRKKLQNEALLKAEEIIAANEIKDFIWVWSDDFHKGVIGIVATQLMQKYNVPTFVGSYSREKGVVVASGRASKSSGIVLTEVLKSQEGFLEKFGGHAQAAGFEVAVDRAEDLKASLAQYFAEAQGDAKRRELMLEFEAQAELSEINEGFMKWYAGLHPFGTDFEAPIFCLENVNVDRVTELRGGHARIRCRQGSSNYSLEALWFGPEESHPCHHKSLKSGDKIDVLGEPQWNEFAGRRSIQILVKDIKWSGDK